MELLLVHYREEPDGTPSQFITGRRLMDLLPVHYMEETDGIPSQPLQEGT